MKVKPIQSAPAEGEFLAERGANWLRVKRSVQGERHMKELIFSLIYTALGAGMMGAYYFDILSLFGILSVIYFIILAVDYTND